MPKYSSRGSNSCRAPRITSCYSAATAFYIHSFRGFITAPQIPIIHYPETIQSIYSTNAFSLEDEDSMVLGNAGIHLQIHAASQPITPPSVFAIYLTTLSITRFIQCQVTQWQQNSYLGYGVKWMWLSLRYCPTATRKSQLGIRYMRMRKDFAMSDVLLLAILRAFTLQPWTWRVPDVLKSPVIQPRAPLPETRNTAELWHFTSSRRREWRWHLSWCSAV
jgi:hypothetical protein